MLGPIDPLTGCINLRVGLNSRHNCRSCDINFAGSFNELFQSRPNVPLSLGEKADGMGMPINAGAVSEPIFLGNSSRAPPRNEVGFDLAQLRVTTQRAVPLVS